MKTLFDIKPRLAKLGKTCMQCIDEIKNRGEGCDAPTFSLAIHGNLRGPKGLRITSMANEIIKEWEAEEDRQKDE